MIRTRSAFEELQVRLLDPIAAIASGVTVRYRADGSALARVGVTYGLSGGRSRGASEPADRSSAGALRRGRSVRVIVSARISLRPKIGF